MSQSAEFSAHAGDDLTFNNVANENERREIKKHGEMKGRETHRSDMTSIRRFLRVNGLSIDDPIKGYLAVPLSVLSKSIKQELLSSTYSKQSKHVYVSRMKRINSIALEMYGGLTHETRSLSEVLTMALNRKKIDEPTLTKAELARRAHLTPKQFGSWYSSGRRRPRASTGNISAARKLEELLNLEKDDLASRLIPIHRSKFTTAREINDRRFAEKKEVNLIEIPYRALVLPDRVASFFEDYVRFKTVPGFKKNLAGTRMNTGAKFWRVKKGKQGLPATARKKLINLETYVGWLMLPSTMEGAKIHIDAFCSQTGKEIDPGRRTEMAQYFIGCGLAKEGVHPAHLVDPDYMGRFIDWMNLRGHQNRQDFIDDALALINENSGFLKQQVEYVWDYPGLGLDTVSMEQSEWKRLYAEQVAKWIVKCSEWRAALRESKKFINRVDHVIHDKLQPILIKTDILSLLRDMIARHASDQPPAKLRYNTDGSVSLAVWIRDQLLLRKLVSNPLRALNFADMTYREDNSGHLRKCPERGWRLVFKPEDFKNQGGAAKKPYDVGLPNELWPLVETYLSKARPILLRNKKEGERGDRVFLTKDGDAFDSGSISHVVYMLTARFGRFDVETVGIRTHAFRHLIATAWLKKHRYDYYTVAKLLHDEIDTVIRNYSHNGADDVLGDYQKELALPAFRFDDQKRAA